MYNEGLSWGKKNEKLKKDVSIENDGFKLYGEYFDFGYERAVVIVAGRTEGLYYSYYFAEPYVRAGYNVLVIDNRSHGLSEGVYNALGLKEYRDILSWCRYLHDMQGIIEVILHGICIGSAASFYALVSPECPSYLVGMTGEGMYTTFAESFKEHLREDKRPVFPFARFFFGIVKRKIGVDAVKNGPEKCMKDLKEDKKILFLHSKEDLYSLPEKTYKMFEKCPAKKKNFVYFNKGRHSFVRINNKTAYDDAIVRFWK